MTDPIERAGELLCGAAVHAQTVVDPRAEARTAPTDPAAVLHGLYWPTAKLAAERPGRSLASTTVIRESDSMRRLTATQAARRFSDLLDDVEHDGETFVVERRGRAVASIGPAAAASGRAVKDLLRDEPPDAHWSAELARVRDGLESEERRWSA